MKVFLRPSAKSRDEIKDGIANVVYYMHKLLPVNGIELVSNLNVADISATHVANEPGVISDVLHCHGLYPTGINSEYSWMFEINARVIDAARKARVVTVPSSWVGEIFQRDMGFSPKIIPHGIQLEEWPDEPKAGPSNVVVWNKNRDTGVCDPKPVNELANISEGFHFISTFGKIRDNVEITGVMPHGDMQNLLYKAGIYFAPTKETFGIGILEAMAAGLPVLGWSWGSLPDIVRHDVEGFVCSPWDMQKTAEGLHYIMDNYERLSRAARKRAEEYSWDKVIPLYAEAYKEALEDKHKESEALISVVIPCYNYERYVSEAINSVKTQEYPNLECIVVDDGSTDSSLTVINEAIAGDGRFRVISKENGGVSSARNTGALAAKGYYLMFLDADDVLFPETLIRLVRPLQRDRGLGIAYGKLRMINAEGEVVRDVGPWPDKFNVSEQLKLRNQVPSCCLMRRDIFMRTGGYRKHTEYTEDAELWSRFPLLGYRADLTMFRPAYSYRWHGGNNSSPTDTNWLAWLPAANGGSMPFASIVDSEKGSHPVFNYDRPLVSFVVPVGDKHRFLLQDAIESVVGQTHPAWEIIVVDDTTDGDVADTGAFPYRLAYPYVKWVRNLQRGNVSAARNLGVASSRGKHLCFLDADDYLLPTFLRDTLLIIEQCKEDSVLVYTDWISKPDGEEHKAENWNVDRLLDHALFAVTFVHPRSSFDAVGGFSEDIELWEDWDYTIKLAKEGYVGIRVPKPLFAYRYDTGRRREDSLSNMETLLPLIRGRHIDTIFKPRRG